MTDVASTFYALALIGNMVYFNEAKTKWIAYDYTHSRSLRTLASRLFLG